MQENNKKISPILFLVFNRPDVTQRVFDEIRKVKPSQLFIAADGPRKGNENDVISCAKTREVVTQIDWECEVQTLFREENLGCGKAVSGAITWFFQNVEAGIILEDDCLPNSSFFDFTSKMLEFYRFEKEVYHISGFSWIQDKGLSDVFYFMRYPNIWGWATWADRWSIYNFNLSKISLDKLMKCFDNLDLTKEERYYQIMTFTNIVREEADTWDYQWKFAVLLNGGLCVTPNFTMIKNIGNVPEATRSINLDASLEMSSFHKEEIEKKVPQLDVEFENEHRMKYIWPKANYFYTLKSLKQKVKNLLVKIINIFN